MKPYRFARVAVRRITRSQVRHALDAQAAATLVEIDRLKQEHERALNAHRDRIESALSAALGDPDLGAYPGDPDGAPDIESLIAMVAGLRRQRDEARNIGYALAADLQTASERIDIDQEVMTRLEGERDEMAAAGRTVVEATDKMREEWTEIEARLKAEKVTLSAALETARLTLAAEQGRPEGAPSQGWTRTTAGWRKGRLRVRPQGWGWGWVLLGDPGTMPLDAGVADTAREAMRVADTSPTTTKDTP